MDPSQVMDKMTKSCRKRLLENKKALSYLYSRKLSDKTIEEFRIGLFPDKPAELFTEIPAKELRSAGIIRNATKSLFTVWRLVMPVCDIRGKTVAIAGRVIMGEDERKKRGIPKYMNTVYAKTHHLFGLHFAKESIARIGTAYVVEGYTDVMSAKQAGISNVVGCCGTVFSNRQLSLLARYADSVIMLFDNDDAGRTAAKRYAEQKDCNEISVSFVEPLRGSGENDIDGFLRTRSAHDLMTILNPEDDYSNVAPMW